MSEIARLERISPTFENIYGNQPFICNLNQTGKTVCEWLKWMSKLFSKSSKTCKDKPALIPLESGIYVLLLLENI